MDTTWIHEDVRDYKARARRIAKSPPRHDPYSTLMLITPDGKPLYCVGVSGGFNGQGINLEFVGAGNPLAIFGGYKFKSSKQAWWHWFEHLKTYPETATFGKPKVSYFEP